MPKGIYDRSKAKPRSKSTAMVPVAHFPLDAIPERAQPQPRGGSTQEQKLFLLSIAQLAHKALDTQNRLIDLLAQQRVQTKRMYKHRSKKK